MTNIIATSSDVSPIRPAVMGTLKAAKAAAGNVMAGNSKIPGNTYSIDSFACINGSKLANVAGSTCSKCYARKLAKLRPSVEVGHKNNLAQWHLSTTAEWVGGIVYQIKKLDEKKQKQRIDGAGFFRWFAAGDLQSVEMLRAIVSVAVALPDVRFWLPTREAAIVRKFIAIGGAIPSNLAIRVSAPMVGDKPLKAFPLTSTVHKGTNYPKTLDSRVCPAYENKGSCGDCRACWNTQRGNISYKQH